MYAWSHEIYRPTRRESSFPKGALDEQVNVMSWIFALWLLDGFIPPYRLAVLGGVGYASPQCCRVTHLQAAPH